MKPKMRSWKHPFYSFRVYFTELQGGKPVRDYEPFVKESDAKKYLAKRVRQYNQHGNYVQTIPPDSQRGLSKWFAFIEKHKGEFKIPSLEDVIDAEITRLELNVASVTLE